MNTITDTHWLKKSNVNILRVNLRKSTQRFHAHNSPEMDNSLMTNADHPPVRSLEARFSRKSNIPAARMRELMTFKMPAEKAIKKSIPVTRPSFRPSIRPPKGPSPIRQSFRSSTAQIKQPRQTQCFSPGHPSTSSGVDSRRSMAARKIPTSRSKRSDQMGPMYIKPQLNTNLPVSGANLRLNMMRTLAQLSEKSRKVELNNTITSTCTPVLLGSARSGANETIATPLRSILKNTQVDTSRLPLSRTLGEARPRAAKKVNFEEARRSLLKELNENKEMGEPGIGFLENSIAHSPVVQLQRLTLPKTIVLTTQKKTPVNLASGVIGATTNPVPNTQTISTNLNALINSLKQLDESFELEMKAKITEYRGKKEVLLKDILALNMESGRGVDTVGVKEENDVPTMNDDARSKHSEEEVEKEMDERSPSPVHNASMSMGLRRTSRRVASTQKLACQTRSATPQSNKLRGVSKKSKAVKKATTKQSEKTSQNGVKASLIYKDLQKSFNLDSTMYDSDELTMTPGSTPLNTPARRKEMSKKMQRELKKLMLSS